MKYLVILAVLFVIDVTSASPLPAKDGPLLEIKQEIAIDDQVHRWSLIPDAAGRMHLIDLNPYELREEKPFNAAEEIIFILHTARNPTAGQVIVLEDLNSLRASNFDPTRETRITIHGWIGSANSTVNRNVAAAYFRRGDYNMITVDWSIGAGSLNYITARNNVGANAAVVARFIDFLHLHGYLQFNNLHVIGHSLGGQAAGLVGKAVTRGRIQVILALDPAGPLFSLANPDERVAPTDGVYVEVIHTNGGVLGFREPIGQADFFPNFGRSQPGCGTDISGQCAHERVNDLHAESINTVFTGHGCTSFADIDNNQCTPTHVTARMGGPYGSVGAFGNFIMTTNDVAPFSQG